MCGIAGFAGCSSLDREDLSVMCDAVAHRGPDSEGHYVVPGRVGLGFRRLAIIDLVTGEQPIANEDASVRVTCNGEIYNFRELRDELRARGHRFSTESDTEVIVHLYEDHGLSFVERLQGMFAIALWDTPGDRLVLARDRMGVKPLYWAEAEGGVVYGSEPGAILASGLIPATPDPVALSECLSLQYVPAPRTGYQGISKLAPGEMLTFERGKLDLSTYWRLEFPQVAEVTSDEDALDVLDGLLRDATTGRLISDVPLGAFLSGGVDSSLVVGYMAELLSEVRTFAIDFPVSEFSEARYAREVASTYGTRHEELLVEPDMVPVVADAARHLGEPFADSSAIPTYLLSSMTRDRVTVALSGDGGDEAFGGYPRYRLAAGSARFDPALRWIGAAGERLLARSANPRSSRARRTARAVARSPQERYAAMMVHFDPESLEWLCQPDFLAAAGGSRRGWEQLLGSSEARGVNRYMALDQRTYLPGDLLTKVDRMSMTHGLEVRSPLLDYRVHELAARLPPRMKIRGRRSKWLLRELAVRRGLSKELARRPKQGFGIPIGHWFRTELKDWITELLKDRVTHSRGYFRREAVDTLIDEHMSGRADHTPRLWNLLMLELWHRAWIDGG